MKRKQQTFVIFLLSLVACFGSCSKEEFTKPATVELKMELAEGEENMRMDGAKNLIQIEKVRYIFSSLDFQGYRQNDGDYFFTKNFDGGLEVVVEEGKPASLLQFDMPQGLYERINISLNVRKSDVPANGADDKLLESAAIKMEGFYTSSKKEKIPLIFLYNYDEVLENPSSSAANGELVTISKSNNNQAVIKFNTAYWMQMINSRMLQSAKLSMVNGTPTIILSENSNEHIFNLLASRIKNASELKFQ